MPFPELNNKSITEKKKVAKFILCSIGDPSNPSTWSGTPYNIYSELAKKNKVVNTFNSDISNKFLINLAKTVAKFFYSFTSNYYRSLPFRYLRAIKVFFKIRKFESAYALHFSTYDMPVFKGKNQSHYLFCDTTWNLWLDNMLEVTQFNKKMHKHLDVLESKCYHQVKHIFPISDYVKQNLVSYYKISPDKITVVGTGRGKILPYYGKKDYANHKILFVAKGRFEDKGGPEVIEAFSRAVKINSKLSLTVVGQDYFINKLYTPNLSVYGFVDDEMLQEIFNTHSVFLMPAVNEPWGLVYLEALVCRMPIIGLNRNGFPEISGRGKYGYMLEQLDVNEIANLLLHVFNNPEELERKGMLGQKFCLQNFSWELTAQKIIDTIEMEGTKK